MDDHLSLAEQLNLPNSLLLPVAFGLSAYSAIRMLAEQFAPVAKALGPLGRRWTQLREQRIAKAANLADLTEQVAKLTQTVYVLQRDNDFLREMRDSNAWTADLQRQVEQLSTTVTKLRDQRELIDAYLDADAEWHRIADIAWHSSMDRETIVREVPEHVPLLAFAREWHAARRQP